MDPALVSTINKQIEIEQDIKKKLSLNFKVPLTRQVSPNKKSKSEARAKKAATDDE